MCTLAILHPVSYGGQVLDGNRDPERRHLHGTLTEQVVTIAPEPALLAGMVPQASP